MRGGAVAVRMFGAVVGDSFVYRLVVEYEPRGGLAGVLDRLLLPRGIRRAFQQTFEALERELTSRAGLDR